MNIRKSIESIALRQGDLIRSNVDMLSWAIRLVSGKKKVPMPKITTLDFVPHVIVSLNGQSFVGPLETQEPLESQAEPSEPHVDQRRKTENESPSYMYSSYLRTSFVNTLAEL